MKLALNDVEVAYRIKTAEGEYRFATSVLDQGEQVAILAALTKLTDRLPLLPQNPVAGLDALILVLPIILEDGDVWDAG